MIKLQSIALRRILVIYFSVAILVLIKSCASAIDKAPELINLAVDAQISGQITLSKNHLTQVGFAEGEEIDEEQLLIILKNTIRVARLMNLKFPFHEEQGGSVNVLTNYYDGKVVLKDLEPSLDIIKRSAKNYTIKYTFANESNAEEKQLLLNTPYTVVSRTLHNLTSPYYLQKWIALKNHYSSLTVIYLTSCGQQYTGLDYTGMFSKIYPLPMIKDQAPAQELTLEQIKYGGIISGQITTSKYLVNKEFGNIDAFLNHLRLETKLYQYHDFAFSIPITNEEDFEETGTVVFGSFDFIRPDLITETTIEPLIELITSDGDDYVVNYSFGKIQESPISLKNLRINVPYTVKIKGKNPYSQIQFKPFTHNIPVVYLNKSNRIFNCYNFVFDSIYEVDADNPIF